jgi:ADP-ribosyl-[dinitrogen reductase] hydrolase
MLKDRVFGVIFGQLIGDALGTRYEFSSKESAEKQVRADMSNGRLDILGGGPFALDAGQVTDDSELAFGLLHSILHNKGYDYNDVAIKYIKWYKSKPFDIGRTIRLALDGAKSYADVCINSSHHNKESLSNGCLMRISPLAVLSYSLDNEDIKKCITYDCSMTNPNDICIDAVTCFVYAIKELLKSGDKHKAYDKALKVCNTQEMFECLVFSKYMVDRIPVTNKHVYTTSDSMYCGYVGVALQNAFYELLHGTSFEKSMIDIMKRGGDTDTTGCIAGALLGAYYGIDKIPYEWIDKVHLYNNPRKENYEYIDQDKTIKLCERLYNLIK